MKIYFIHIYFLISVLLDCISIKVTILIIPTLNKVKIKIKNQKPIGKLG